MSWDDKGAAVTFLLADDTTEYLLDLRGGSTATVEVDEGGNAVARLYIKDDGRIGPDPITSYVEEPVGAAADWSPSGNLLYMDSTRWTAGATATPTFDYFHLATTTAIQQTEIPLERDMSGWRIPYITDLSAFAVDPASGLANVPAPEGSTVGYMHPSVVKLPDSTGYMMIMTRRRSPDDLLTSASSSAPDGGKHQVLSDIVAWRCTDAGFTGSSLVGPIMLVSSLEAVPGQTVRLWLGVAGGALVSRQDGADQGDNSSTDASQAGHDLYLYFAVELPEYPALSDEALESSSGEDLHLDAVQAYTDDQLTGDYLEPLYPQETINRVWEGTELVEETSSTAEKQMAVAVTRGGIALKVLALDDVNDAFDTLASSSGGRYPEENWTWSGASGSPAVPGELKGWVRVWIAVNEDGGPAGGPFGAGSRTVTTFPRRFPARVATRPVSKPADPDSDDGSVLWTTDDTFDALYKGPTDPAPAICADGTLSLHFSIIHYKPFDFSFDVDTTDIDKADLTEFFSGANGHGVWRSAAIPGGKKLKVSSTRLGGGATVTTEFGLDFVVAVVGSVEIELEAETAGVVTCRDQVAPSYAEGSLAATYYGWFGEFVDPDPFGTSDGKWWVHAAGKGDADDPSAFSLQRFKNFPTAFLALTSACRPWDEAWGSSPFEPHL